MEKVILELDKEIQTRRNELKGLCAHFDAIDYRHVQMQSNLAIEIALCCTKIAQLNHLKDKLLEPTNVY